MTGIPSIDKPWLKYYKENAEKIANTVPQGKTIWDVIEENLKKYSDTLAIEYFGRKISRPEFIKEVYKWAKVFKMLGVKENDVIPFYAIFTPAVCSMIFALNMLGACPYFLKFAISKKSLEEETSDCKIAIVFDKLFNNVQEVFLDKRFEKIILIKVSDDMTFPKKLIFSILSTLHKTKKIPKNKKIASASKIIKLATKFSGNLQSLKAPFKNQRRAFITSSSGTSNESIAKGIVATNETALSLILFAIASEIPFTKGDRVLNNLPPMAATSINAMFLNPLYRGATIIMDPRISEKNFYNQLTKGKPNIVLYTSAAWESFFNRIEKEIKKKKFDFSYATYWIIGGEGTDVKKYKKWNEIMTKCGGQKLFSGYGQSELFSATCVENNIARYDCSKPIMSVGIPYAGITTGVFDKNNKELSYNERGELWIKSISAMKEYYKKPELTARVKENGWIKTGDLAEIDEKGFVYIWGRMSDSIVLSNGETVYLFDLANIIKENTYIADAMVIQTQSEIDSRLVAHIVWEDSVKDSDKAMFLKKLTEELNTYDKNIKLNTFACHKKLLPYSPASFKKDKNKMSKQKDGLIQVINGDIIKL